MHSNCDCACEAPIRVEETAIKSAEKQPAATAAIMGHEKARDVNISQLDYGYIVRVGCQSFAIQNLDILLTLLSSYMRDPSGFETMWREGNLVIA